MQVGNLSEASDIAHSLKGAARELKATKFEQLASQIEHSNQVDDVKEVMPRLTSCLQTTLDAYNRLNFEN